MLPFKTLIKTYKKRLLRRMPQEGSFPTAISGVELHRRDTPTEPGTYFMTPRILLLVQGCTHTVVGATDYYCREGDLLVAGVGLPNTSRISDVAPEGPAMSMCLDLDKALVAQLIMDMPTKDVHESPAGTGFTVQPLEVEILDAFVRMEALLDTPEHIPTLAPMIIREIHYRLLVGPSGDILRTLYTYGSKKNNVVRALAWLEENYQKPLRVDFLAEMVHMSSCTFHRYFKETTSLSPLQYQKTLRLHEAQRLMFFENMDVNRACEAVGYESLTQFTREYKRLFGEPPYRNITQLKRRHGVESAYPRSFGKKQPRRSNRRRR